MATPGMWASKAAGLAAQKSPCSTSQCWGKLKKNKPKNRKRCIFKRQTQCFQLPSYFICSHLLYFQWSGSSWYHSLLFAHRDARKFYHFILPEGKREYLSSTEVGKFSLFSFENSNSHDQILLDLFEDIQGHMGSFLNHYQNIQDKYERNCHFIHLVPVSFPMCPKVWKKSKHLQTSLWSYLLKCTAVNACFHEKKYLQRTSIRVLY